MLPFQITRQALLDHWSRALPRVLDYMAYPAEPFNQGDVGAPGTNRRLYDWLPLGIAYQQAFRPVPNADLSRIEALAKQYLNTPWQWEKPPEAEHRLLGELHAAIGIALVLGSWPIQLLNVVKAHAERPNLEWATDKLMLLVTAVCMQPHPSDRPLVVPIFDEIRRRQHWITGEPGNGRDDDITWWPVAGGKYADTPMSWSHFGRAFLMVDAIYRSRRIDAPYALRSQLVRTARAAVDCTRGTTWENCGGKINIEANQKDRSLSMQFGHWSLLCREAPDLVRAWVTGTLLSEHSKWPYAVDTNDESTHGLGRLTLAAAGLAVV